MQYASCTMNSAEENASACRLESPAVIYALRKFRVYLLSTKPCRSVTDYQALYYALKNKDINGRMARLIEFIAEYEYEVQYRPSANSEAAYYLSRAVPIC